MPSETFTSDTDWTVPANITRVAIDARGQPGEGGDGGNGGRVAGEVAVSPGDTLYLRFPSDGGNAEGDYDPNCDGGDSADVRYGGTTLNDRIAVGAGGGGQGVSSGSQGYDASGGDGGADTGQSGLDGYGEGGGGGTQSSGGNGGSTNADGGDDGSFGQGGDGGSGGETDYIGGGGGGGWYGGGGGSGVKSLGTAGTGGGGGGGSNYDDGLDTVTANERGTSTSREITITYTVPPANVTADTVRYRSADLSWDAVSSADSYVVYRDGTEVGSTTTTSFTDTGLSPETSYSWEVATVSSGSESGKSNTATGTTGGSAPSNVAVSESGTDVTLTWTDTNGDEDGYEIHRAQSSGVDTSGAPLATTAANAESYTDTNPTEGRDYWYRVVAVRNDERGVDSAERGITVPLPAPTGLTVDDVRDADADLSWTTNTADADAHRVYVKEGDGRTGMDFDSGDRIEGPEMGEMDGLTATLHIEPDIDISDEAGNWFGNATSNSGWMFYRSGVYIGEADSGGWLANTGIGTPAIGESAWLTFTFDGANLRTYYNGSLSNTVSANGTINGTSVPVGLGKNPDSSWNNAEYDGTVFSAQIHSRALSESEVAQIHSGNFVTDGLTHYWPLDLNLSGVTPDVSGYGNDGTVNGATLTGPPLTDATGALSGSATSGTPSGLLNGQLYEAYLHAETTDATVRDQ